jgi:PLP dependent protein
VDVVSPSDLARARPAERADELAADLARVRERIAGACADAGRPVDDVRLVVVTKFFPASDVRLLARLGVTDVGENRHQEAETKAAELADLGLAWHFIGGLQSNKAAAVAAYARVVESVDRAKLVAPLSRGAHARGEPLDVLLQVSLDPPGAAGGRSGADPDHLAALADRVAEAEGLHLRGLMAVAPRDEEPEAAFGRLAAVRSGFVERHPEATWLSAGMSGDLEEAIRAGATHVRVGSAILGPRPTIQ